MEAGWGAEEQATRRSRKVQRLRQERDADAAARSAVEAELERARRQQRAWAVGAEGERLVAATLETLAPYGWTALHDLHWPGRPLANIDHIAIGPGGVVVIDAKNWSGHVAVESGTLRQNGYRRDREVEGAAQAAQAVAALFQPQHRQGVHAVICLAGQDQTPTVCEPGVVVAGRLQLAQLLLSLPTRFSPYDVADIGRHLGRTLGEPARDGSPAARVPRTPAPSSRPRGKRLPLDAVVAPPARSERTRWGCLLELAVAGALIIVGLVILSALNG